MESGLFNNIIKVDNYVIKISKRDSEISNQVMEEMSFGTPEEYAMHINNVGIKTAKIQSSFICDDYDILVQEYIEGETIQQLLNNENVDINVKIRVFEKFLDLYKLSEKDSNLCLDWNMKNFILNNDEIYYVDLTPCLYKNKIMQSKSDNLSQYRESYLNRNIQLAGILGYAIMPFVKYKSKEEVQIVYNKFLNILKEKLIFDLSKCSKEFNHVYFYKLLQIQEHINSNITYEEMVDNISSYSMEKISKYPETKKNFMRTRNNGG